MKWSRNWIQGKRRAPGSPCSYWWEPKVPGPCKASISLRVMQTSVPEQARGSLVAALKPLWGCSCACITNAMSLTDLCRLGPKVIQIYPESSQSYPSTQRMVIPKIYKPGGILHLVGEGNVQDIDDIDQNHSKSLTLDKQMGGFI